MDAELFRAGGWADMTKLMVHFHNFANAPKCVILHAGHLEHNLGALDEIQILK
jgi:hypothetical protein